MQVLNTNQQPKYKSKMHTCSYNSTVNAGMLSPVLIVKEKAN
uniref:Uncharacterized protein n=1 Tax=Anguilla anguilla TaxID=7936 RepID=A0A0E9U0M5_ANGAN